MSYLGWWLKYPLVSWFLLIAYYGLREFMSDGGLH